MVINFPADDSGDILEIHTSGSEKFSINDLIFHDTLVVDVDYNNLKYTIGLIKSETIQFINTIKQKKINFIMFCDSFKSNKQLFSFKKINDHMTDIYSLIFMMSPAGTKLIFYM